MRFITGLSGVLWREPAAEVPGLGLALLLATGWTDYAAGKQCPQWYLNEIKSRSGLGSVGGCSALFSSGREKKNLSNPHLMSIAEV